MIRASLLVAFAIAALSPAAHAQTAVYRNVDADGKVTYSDQPVQSGSPKVKRRVAPGPSGAAYDAAVNRSESERLYYERQRAEDQSRRPINIYDPRGSSSSSEPALAPGPSYPWRYGYDPNLPASPPPSSERRYYYDGR
jgi:hypothetical protein